jgi:hypothetical protein
VDDLIIGAPLAGAASELPLLIAKVRAREIRAERVDEQADGDIRFWGIDQKESPLLEQLVEFAQASFVKAVGRLPATTSIMINHIEADRCPGGSGGGWHRDSFGRQFKAFTYLTEVTRDSQGPFAYIPSSNRLPARAVSLVHRLVTGANRYTDDTIRRIPFFTPRSVFVAPGVPFFVDTSLVHRGMAITEGQRIMATVYMFEAKGSG